MAATIRQATPNDAAALAALAAVTFPLACPPGSDPADIAHFLATSLTEADFAAHLADPARAVFVLESAPVEGAAAVDGDGTAEEATVQLLGYAMFVDAPASDASVAAATGGGDAVELSKFYLHPDEHGRGLAARLMAHGLAWTQSGGPRAVWLGVNAENARARRFYEKHGFAVAGTRTFVLGSRRENDFVMVRGAGETTGAAHHG